MKTIIGILLLAMAMVGCTHEFTEVTAPQLDQAFILNSSPTFRGYDYLGTEHGYHYFVAKWKYGSDKRFKLSATDMTVRKESPFGSGTVEVYPYKPTTLDTEEFGELGNTKLYRRR